MKKLTLMLATSVLMASNVFAATVGHEHTKKTTTVTKTDKALVAVTKEDKKVESPIKLEGLFDFYAGTRAQGKIKRGQRKLSAHNSNIFFNTQANLTAKIQYKADDLNYGAKLVLLTTAAPKTTASYNGSHIYIASDDFGKIELGTPFNVHHTMSIDAGDIASATGGSSWVHLIQSNPNDLINFDVNVEDFYLAGFKSQNLMAYNREPSRKINYYSPTYNGFQLGLTFIPDSTNGGSDRFDQANSYKKTTVTYYDGTTKRTYDVRYGATNAYAIGLTYQNQINEEISYKIAVTGEFGKAIQQAAYKNSSTDSEIDSTAVNNITDNILIGDHKLANLRAYNIGGKLTHGKLSYALSYGDLGKSFTSRNTLKFNNSRRSRFYSAGVSYAEGPMKVSLIYRGANTRKIITNAFAVASDYMFKPGLCGFGEVGYGYVRGTGGYANDTTYTIEKKFQKAKGASFLLGLRVKV